MKDSPPIFMSSKDEIINEAQLRTYMLSIFLRGRGAADVFKSGSKIKDEIMFDEANTFQGTRPGQTHTWSNPQVQTEWETNWRFYIDHMAWTDQEIELNDYDSLTVDAKVSLHKKIRRSKEQRMWTSIFNGMEARMWAEPVYADMEVDNGLHAYSIPAFINEETNGVYWNATSNLLQNINAATESKWQCQQVTYDYDDFLDIDRSGDGLVDGFDDVWLQAKFDTPDFSMGQMAFESDAMTRQHIVTGRNGMLKFTSALRSLNDRTVSPQDPSYGQPTYRGVPLKYISTLDTAALYAGPNSTRVTESAATVNGPRYYFINSKYLRVFFHDKYYFKRKAPMVHPNQPDTTIQPCNVWWNLVARSLQRQAILYPVA